LGVWHPTDRCDASHTVAACSMFTVCELATECLLARENVGGRAETITSDIMSRFGRQPNLRAKSIAPRVGHRQTPTMKGIRQRWAARASTGRKRPASISSNLPA